MLHFQSSSHSFIVFLLFSFFIHTLDLFSFFSSLILLPSFLPSFVFVLFSLLSFPYIPISFSLFLISPLFSIQFSFLFLLQFHLFLFFLFFIFFSSFLPSVLYYVLFFLFSPFFSYYFYPPPFFPFSVYLYSVFLPLFFPLPSFLFAFLFSLFFFSIFLFPLVFPFSLCSFCFHILNSSLLFSTVYNSFTLYSQRSSSILSCILPIKNIIFNLPLLIFNVFRLDRSITPYTYVDTMKQRKKVSYKSLRNFFTLSSSTFP